jgi:hypothetical protein
MDEEGNWRAKTLLLGGVIGALTGLAAAYMLVQRAERQGEPPKLGAGEGVKLGVWVLGLLRRIGDLGQG